LESAVSDDDFENVQGIDRTFE
jgi:hypothetical protein